MNIPQIPEYYFDKELTEQKKIKKDWEMVAKDFPITTKKDKQLLTNEPSIDQ